MLGTLRFAFAVLVALSHINVRLLGLNPGVCAVVGFYLISGYVVTGLLRTHYARPGQLRSFYADRAVRIFPHYLFICALVLTWYQANSPHALFFLSHPPGWGDLLNNLLVVPLNFYMFNQADGFTLVPPTWSLGVEIQFYLLLPLILLGQYRRGVIVASLAVFALACLGVLNTDWYGYRLLPGVLFLFLTGSALYDWHHTPGVAAGRRVLGAWCAAFVLALVLLRAGLFGRLYTKEILLGFLVALPLIHKLAPLARSAWDDWLGNLSYGVFLNHFFVMWVVFDSTPQTVGQRALFLLLSIGLAALLHRFVEKPVLALRHRLRLQPAV